MIILYILAWIVIAIFAITFLCCAFIWVSYLTVVATVEIVKDIHNVTKKHWAKHNKC